MEFTTRLINLYSNRYLEYKIQRDLEYLFNSELKKKPPASESIVIPNQGVSPVILLGMHRSGTTLVSKLLRESGIYMGRLRGKDTDESLFFQNVNKAIFKLSGASWDQPGPLKSSLENESHHQTLVNILGQYCLLPKNTRSYFAGSHLGTSTLFSMPDIWGWKDPRSCFSLPLWLALFPKAKIIYIQRNGVDVAQSLVVRNQRLGGRQPFSVKTADLPGAFRLWEAYNQQCLVGISSIDSRHVHVVGYEDLLANPADVLTQIFSFLEHDRPVVTVNNLVKNIDSQKAYSFTKNPELVNFYQKIKDTELMQIMGYGSL